MRKNIQYKNILLVILSLSLIFLGYRLTTSQNIIKEYSDLEEQQELLLGGEGRAPGFSCGLLNTKKAKEILDTNNIQFNYGQGPTDKVGTKNIQIEKIYWSDNCRYEDVSNNTNYVELFVKTFQSDIEASSNFTYFLPTVKDSMELESSILGQKLIYDSGVYYLLRDNQIIQFSTSKSEKLSKIVFEELLLLP
jgi:hypothetical protein